MSKQRSISTRMWSDSYFEKLDPTEKLFFIYLLTNIYTNICGIYEIPLKIVAVETGIDKEMILKLLQRFENDKKVYYIDWHICIRNFVKNQNSNPSVQKWIEREISEKPQDLIDKIQAVYNVYTGCIQDGTLNLTKPNLTKPENLVIEKSLKQEIEKSRQEISHEFDIYIEPFIDYRSETDKKWNEKRTKEKTRNTILRLKKRQMNAETNFGKSPLIDYTKPNNFKKALEEWKTDFLKNKFGIEKFTELKRQFLSLT